MYFKYSNLCSIWRAGKLIHYRFHFFFITANKKKLAILKEYS